VWNGSIFTTVWKSVLLGSHLAMKPKLDNRLGRQPAYLTSHNNFFNPILFAICTSTFSKLCVMYTVTCRRELNRVPL
jgi:hypothetical protein